MEFSNTLLEITPHRIWETVFATNWYSAANIRTVVRTNRLNRLIDWVPGSIGCSVAANGAKWNIILFPGFVVLKEAGHEHSPSRFPHKQPSVLQKSPADDANDLAARLCAQRSR